MIINDSEIQRRCIADDLVVPYLEENLQPHSLDLTLGFEVLQPIPNPNIAQGTNFWAERDNVWDRKTLHREGDDSELAIPPGYFLLAMTEEYLNMPQDLVGNIVGKSTIGRRGLQIECAGFVDAGFSGNITLELYNTAPYIVKVRRGDPICQIVFSHVEPPVVTDYRKTGHYNGQRGATPPYSIG